jgi:hypothetical protein
MEEQLKRIEEKLDLVISVMAVNPEFENFVKEGKLKLHLEKVKANMVAHNADTEKAWRREIELLLMDWAIELKEWAPGRRDSLVLIGVKPLAPEYVEQLIFEIGRAQSKENRTLSNELCLAIADRVITESGYLLSLKKYLVATRGAILDISEELEKERLRYLEENK